MNFFYKVNSSLLLMIGLLGCGTSSVGDSSNNLIVETHQSLINEAKDKMILEFSLKNNYKNGIDVLVNNLNLNVTPCRISHVEFSENSISLNSTIREKEINATVSFNKSCEPTSYSLEGDTSLTLDGRTNHLKFISSTEEISPSLKEDTIIKDGNGTSNVGDTSLPIVVIPTELKNITIQTNQKEIDIPIHVFKDIAPFTAGSVKVELPKKVLNGTDVGLFSSYEVPVNEQGIALFHYTSPSNMQALMESGDISSSFKFYHVNNSENRQLLTMTYKLEEDNTYIPVNYSLDVTTQDSKFYMGIPNVQKTFSIVLEDIKGNTIKNSDITIKKVLVETQNSLIAQLVDTATQNLVDSLELKNDNNIQFILKSKKLSGLVPVKVDMDFIDINKEEKHLSTIVNVRVMSGPPSAISISYVSTGHDASRAKYEEKFAISVTDEYGNKVNTQPYISVGAIVGYAVDGSASSSKESSNTKRLYYGKSAIEDATANGELKALGDELANTTNFEDNTPARSNVFKWVNAEGANSDKLVVFGKGKNYEAMGKWDFSKIDNSTLKLEDDYFGIDRGDLSYAIGHNYYQDQCLDDSREWLGSTDSETYQLDDEGTAIVNYKYDYHLTGKDALVWVNLNGYQSDTEKNTRIGEVTKHTLRGKGLKSVPESGYSIPKGAVNHEVSFDIHHVNAPEWYRNGNFGFEIPKTECSYSIISGNVWGDGHLLKDARSCDNGGVSSVTFSVSAPDENTSCTFNIDNILVADEF